MKVLVGLFLVGLFHVPPTLAQDDAAEIRSGVLEFYRRLNAADPSYVSFWHPEATSYARAGGLLGSEVGLRSESAVQAAFDAGLEYNVSVRNLEAKVFNGTSAIATYYTEGTVKNPAGQSVEGGSYRATMVWAKDGGEWRIVHLHLSRLGYRNSRPAAYR